MPHSISPKTAPAEPQMDIDTQDTPTVTAENGTNQEDEEMISEDVAAEGDQVPEVPVKVEAKSDVKLEDLFADVESDEEFPSSNYHDMKASSPVEAPSSPVYELSILGYFVL